jgi:cell division protein FtsZ
VPENAPMVKPINEFVTVKAEDANANAEMFLKKDTQRQQTGLFDLFAKGEEATSQQQQPAVIKHSLMPEEPVAQGNDNEPGMEFTFKVTESVMNFEPVMQAEPVTQPEPEPQPVVGADDNKTDESIEEQLRKSRERIMRLKDLSMKLRNGNLQELENVPAYKRKEIALQQTPMSDESQISRFSLTDTDGQTEIRKNNSFLHDNVD